MPMSGRIAAMRRSGGLRQALLASVSAVALIGVASSAEQQTPGFPAVFELAELLPENGGDGRDGFVLKGIDHEDRSGYSVSGAGDVNGDGIDDLIIGAPRPPTWDGAESYVVFGSKAGFASNLNLAKLDGANGFVVKGRNRNEHAGHSVSGAGDVNGDGVDDVIVATRSCDLSCKGNASVVFGSKAGFPPAVELSDLNGTNGFTLRGNGLWEYSPDVDSVSGAGDVNGDGIDDVIIAAYGWTDGPAPDLPGNWVVFGSDAGFPANLEFADLDGEDGFGIHGSHGPVSGTGDFNGDGIDDVIIGSSSKSYVVFGSEATFPAVVELSDLNGVNGFALNGAGRWVSEAGDVNGDGIDDVIIGGSSIKSYVVFGSEAAFPAVVELSDLNGVNGFALSGAGRSVSGVGDINGDGIDDLMVGAPEADPNGKTDAGRSYVVFGSG